MLDGTGFLGAKNHYSMLRYLDGLSRVGPINISISKHVYDPEPNFIF